MVGSTEMKGCRLMCHMAGLPPHQAFLWSRVMEGMKESSFLRCWQKSGKGASAVPDLLLPELREENREDREEPVAGGGQVQDGNVYSRELGKVNLAAVHVLLNPGIDEDLGELLGRGFGAMNRL